MSAASLVESLESVGISRSFYTGGLLRVAGETGLIYSLHNGALSIVDPISGQTYARINVDNDPIYTFAVSPRDNREVITVGKSNLCRHWSISDPHDVVPLRAWASSHIHPVLCMDISHDGSLVATSSVDRTIRVFSVSGYYSVAVYRMPAMQDPISMIRFFPNRRALASLGVENSIAVWDLDESSSLQEPIRELKGHMSTVHVITFSGDGSRMFTSGNDQMVISWDISSYPQISLASQVAVFESVQAVLPLGRSSFITGGDKGEIRCWNEKKCVSSVKSGHSAQGHIRNLYLLPQTGEVLAVGADLACSIWTLAGDNKGITFSRQMLGNMGEILSVKFMNKSKILCALNDEFPRIIDTNNFSCIAKLEGHSEICLCVATGSQVGSALIATGSKDQTVRLWDASTLACTAVLTGHTGPVNCVVFTKKQYQVVSASEDGCIKIWRTSTGKGVKKMIIRSIIAHSKSVNSLAISGNDRFIASGSQDRTAKVFSLEDGALIGTFSGHKGSILSVDFSPIEQVLATASRDGTVKLWNLSNPGGPCIRTLEGHEHSVMSCRFLQNGLQIISADAAGIIRLWNVRNGECAVIAMTDGQVIVSGGAGSDGVDDFSESESSAKIWAMDICEGSSPLTVVSGTSSGTLNLWTDNTEKIQLTRRLERADQAEKDTSVQVLIKAGKLNEAFKMAFALNRPKLMLEILKESNWGNCPVDLDQFLDECDNKERLEKIVQEWIKASKTCSAACKIVGRLDSVEAIDSVKFETFAEKHMARLCALSQKCYIIDSILLASNSTC